MRAYFQDLLESRAGVRKEYVATERNLLFQIDVILRKEPFPNRDTAITPPPPPKKTN